MSDSFDLGEPPVPATTPYRVLARKYRPQRFSELLGQDAMVTTLGNAIARDRLAHAFLLTGVRGVGKTSTARLIAKGLNCIGPAGDGGPTIDPCGVCEPCRAIAEGRHIDVIEMDAASHTGVDDVREIIDASRYAAVSARYKIYIVDEVHMLSKNAFNALLKTLEEPPAHVKFLFATTEVNKVPITVLSRCQRFDLRRIPAELLATHFAAVAQAEGMAAEPEALAMIARAAEGSARDGLSILDQAIAHAGAEGGDVTAVAVREMLGLSDRGAVRDLLGHLVAGEGPAALAALRRQYDLGVDPTGVLRGLLELVHAATLAKLGTPPEPGQAGEERDALAGWAETLSFPVLHRLWQLLLKSHEEVGRAALPIEAAEMALLRIVHAAGLPDPEQLARMLAGTIAPPVLAVAAEPVAAAGDHIGTADAAQLPSDFAGLVALLDDRGEHALAARLRHSGRVIRYAPPELALSTALPLPPDLLRELSAELRRLTDRVWRVTTADAPGQPTLHEAEETARRSTEAAILATPIVAAAKAAFPNMEVAGGEIDRLMAAGWKEQA